MCLRNMHDLCLFQLKLKETESNSKQTPSSDSADSASASAECSLFRFSMPCICAAVLAVLTTVRFDSESDDEELCAAHAAMTQWMNRSRVG